MGRGTSTTPAGAIATGWWQRPAILASVILLSTVPLLYPKVPPLVDLLGHMGRYRVELDIGSSPWLRHYYGFHWAMIGNLGVDLLVLPLGHLLGLEPAVKLIVLAIPPLTIAGFLWVTLEVHGRIPPTAFFALPFAYSQPFLYGFVNYALSMALAFLGFALWLRLGRLGRTRLRSILFVPISVVIFFVHAYGWGVLGLLCFSAEAVRQHDRGIGWLKAGWNAAWHASVMALPAVIMLVWRSETSGGFTGDWFNWKSKFDYFLQSLRDRWKPWDVAGLVIALCVIVEARRREQLSFSRNLAFSALVLLAGYILLPRIIFSSAYADMRLIPFVVAVALLAIRFRDDASRRVATAFAAAGLAFFAARMLLNAVSLGMSAHAQEQKLEALDHVPLGAKVVALVGEGCGYGWALPRDSHLPSMVIVRKQGFANDQWVISGQNLLSLRYSQAGWFGADPSQRVRLQGCEIGPYKAIDTALAAVPNDAFDYLWLIDPPPFDHRLVEKDDKVASGRGWSLYRLSPAAPAQR